jgi:hypothetical protein
VTSAKPVYPAVEVGADTVAPCANGPCENEQLPEAREPAGHPSGLQTGEL